MWKKFRTISPCMRIYKQRTCTHTHTHKWKTPCCLWLNDEKNRLIPISVVFILHHFEAYTHTHTRQHTHSAIENKALWEKHYKRNETKLNNLHCFFPLTHTNSLCLLFFLLLLLFVCLFVQNAIAIKRDKTTSTTNNNKFICLFYFFSPFPFHFI